MHNYDRDGRDVGVGYNSDTGIMLTVYVYPARRSSPETGKDLLEEHYQGAKGTALRNSPGAQLVSEGPSRVMQNGKGYSGKRAVMTLENFRAMADPSWRMKEKFLGPTVAMLHEEWTKGKGPQGISELRLFRYGEHFIKYRITYGEAIRDKAEKEIEDFISALRWPSEAS